MTAPRVGLTVGRMTCDRVTAAVIRLYEGKDPTSRVRACARLCKLISKVRGWSQVFTARFEAHVNFLDLCGRSELQIVPVQSPNSFPPTEACENPILSLD